VAPTNILQQEVIQISHCKQNTGYNQFTHKTAPLWHPV